MKAQLGPFGLGAPTLAGVGLRVFPVRASAGPACSTGQHIDPEAWEAAIRASKQPAIRNWQGRAATAAERVAGLATRHGPCNIGVATGRGLVVLDIDTKHGKDGYVTLRALEAEHGPLPVTVAAQTPTGGKHLYFRAPESVHVAGSVGRLGAGLDVRGHGGYVVAPPSVRPDGAYVWQPGRAPWELKVADLPEAWLALLRIPRAEPAATACQLGANGATTPYGAAALASEAEVVAGTPEGGRNNRLSRASYAIGQLVQAGHVATADAVVTLDAAGAASGLSDPRERQATIRSGLSAGKRHLRPKVPPPKGAQVPALTIATLDALQPTLSRGNRLIPGQNGYTIQDAKGREVPGLDLPVVGLDADLVCSISHGINNLGGVIGFRVLHFQVCTAHRQYIQGVPDFHRLQVPGACLGLAEAIGSPGKDREVRAVVLAQAHLRFRFADGSRGNLLQYEEPIAAAPGRRAVLVMSLGRPLLPGYASALPLATAGRRHRVDRWLVPFLPDLPRLDSVPPQIQAAAVRLHWWILRELASRPSQLATLGGIRLGETDWQRLAGAAGLSLEYLPRLLASWRAADLCPAFLAEVEPGLWTLGSEHAQAVAFILARLDLPAVHRRRVGYAG